MGLLVARVDGLTAQTATVAPNDAIDVHDLGFGMCKVAMHVGFVDHPDVPALIGHTAARISNFQTETASYYVSAEQIIATPGAGRAGWRKRLFAGLAHPSIDIAEYFRVPLNDPGRLGPVSARIMCARRPDHDRLRSEKGRDWGQHEAD